MSFEDTKADFGENAKQELEKIQMLTRLKDESLELTPCAMFNTLNNDIPLSIFIRVYPFNELVDCGLGFTLDELMELETLYYTLDKGDQQLYIDSLRRLQQMIGSTVSANQEVQDVLRNPEPPQEDINKIAGEYYMQNRIPSTPPVPPVPSVPQTLFGRIKSYFSRGGRKTAKKMYQKRSKSRSKKSHSKKSRSKSRSNK
jgi:hypothetical protein